MSQHTDFEQWQPGMPIDSDIVQPAKWEFHGADNVFIKQIFLEKAGYTVPGHSHTYDHTSMLAAGRVRMWRRAAPDLEDELVGDFTAPTGLEVKAGYFHRFLALEAGTILYCIHNTHGFPRDQLEAELLTSYHPEGRNDETPDHSKE